MVRIGLSLFLVLCCNPLQGQYKILEGGVVGQEITSIDLYRSLKVAYRDNSIATINMDGSVSIFESLKLSKTFPATSFAGFTTTNDGAGKVSGADIYIPNGRLLSVATFIKTDTGVAYCYIDSIDQKTWKLDHLVGCGDTITSFDGTPWTVFRTGNRFVQDDRFGSIFYLHLKKGNLNTQGLFRLTKDASGKNWILPLSVGTFNTSPQSYNAYVLVNGELLYLSSITNLLGERILKGYRMDNGSKRDIQTPKGCLFIDESSDGGFALGCGNPGNRLFYKSQGGQTLQATMSGIFQTTPLSASQPKPGLVNAFVGSSSSVPNYFYTISSGNSLGFIDILNARVITVPLGELNSEIAVIGDKVLVGTPTGTFSIPPILMTSVTESGGTVQGTGINFSLPGFKSELLLNGTPVSGAVVTETTFRAVLESPPSGVAEVSLRLVSLKDGATVKSLNTAKVSFPVTVLAPRITKVIPNSDGGTGGVENVVSLGMIVQILGEKLSAGLPPELSTAQGGVSLPLRLNGSEVLLDGVTPLPLYYAQPTQVNAVVPKTTVPGKHWIMIRRYDLNGKFEAESEKFELLVEKILPAFLTFTPEGADYKLLFVQRPDGSWVTPDQPLRPGEIVRVYATGLGATHTGEFGLQWLDASVEVRVNQTTLAEVLFAGETQFPGLYQIDLRIPDIDAGVEADDSGLVSLLFQVENPSAEFLINFTGNKQ